MISEDTEVTEIKNFKTSNIVYSDPIVNQIPNSTIKYKRIMIGIKNPNGTTGDLVLKTSKLFSYGITENLDQATQKINGYSMGICLWDRDSPSKEEKLFTTTIDKFVEYTKKYLIKNRDDIEIYDLEMANLKKFNPLYWKKENGKKVVGLGPVLYPKLMISKKQNKKDPNKPIVINTNFYRVDSNDQVELYSNPLEIKDQYCYINAGVKIESIFIGSNEKCSLQIKLIEAEVKPIVKNRRLLLRNNMTITDLTKKISTKLNINKNDSNTSDEDISESSEEENPRKKKHLLGKY